ncbi:MAG: serine/threonine-protein kinase, partial [Myxococcota bacterium]
MQREPAVPTSLAGGRYVLEERLGAGATSIVYAALDIRLGVRRAVKILNPPPEVDRRLVSKRLRAEAQAMARLAHPNIVTVHDIAVEGPFEYVVMDLAPGGALIDRLYDHGPLPAEHVVSWMIDILSALAFAHARAIVHRDVKPGNILLDGQDRA